MAGLNRSQSRVALFLPYSFDFMAFVQREVTLSARVSRLFACSGLNWRGSLTPSRRYSGGAATW